MEWKLFFQIIALVSFTAFVLGLTIPAAAGYIIDKCKGNIK